MAWRWPDDPSHRGAHPSPPVVAYVIIPGFDGSDEQRWQTLWERQWGASAVRISPASWSAPRPGRLGRRRPGGVPRRLQARRSRRPGGA
ncbi:alpha/beta hydrolase [Streptomyces sp. JHA19]|uniref:alpha/beta hydrolase n=1 Tax=Streptomyces sp. JHA19 TaxID=1577588 RepID=UPI00351CA166